MKLLSDVDMGDKRNLQRYEDTMRVRLQKFGYRIVKRKTIKPGFTSTNKDRGFRIVSISSGGIVAGENHNLSLADVEAFWLELYKEQDTKRQEKQYKKWLKKNHAVQIDGGWIITNDDRAISVLKDHVKQYGDFDIDGHSSGGDIWNVVYRAYRPWCCPEFNHVWPVDGNWHNLTDCNLRSDADETTLPNGVLPITTQRRIWHDKYRIFLKLPIRDQLFFTEYTEERYHILANKTLNGWYVQPQCRNTKTAYRLYCRIDNRIVSMAEIVALHDAGKVDADNIADSILTGKKWLRDDDLQVDHLKDNPQNNCAHNLCIVKGGLNGGKSDSVTEIMLPYVFIPVRIGEVFRVLCGKAQYHTDTNNYDLATLKMIACQGTDEFLKLIKAFREAVKANGDMSKRPDDHNLTSCVAQMIADDGQEYHDGKYNANEKLLGAEESDFMPYPEIGTLC